MEFCINLLLMHCLTFIFFTARLGRKIVTNTRLGRNWLLMDSFALRLCRFFFVVLFVLFGGDSIPSVVRLSVVIIRALRPLEGSNSCAVL